MSRSHMYLVVETTLYILILRNKFSETANEQGFLVVNEYVDVEIMEHALDRLFYVIILLFLVLCIGFQFR